MNKKKLKEARYVHTHNRTPKEKASDASEYSRFNMLSGAIHYVFMEMIY